MKNIITAIVILLAIQGCKTQLDKTKHFNSRNLTNKEVSCTPVPEIDHIEDVYGRRIDTLNDGVYIVVLTNGKRVKVIN